MRQDSFSRSKSANILVASPSIQRHGRILGLASPPGNSQKRGNLFAATSTLALYELETLILSIRNVVGKQMSTKGYPKFHKPFGNTTILDRRQKSELEIALLWLTNLVDKEPASKFLPVILLAQAHSWIGIIRQQLNGEHEAASRSFLSALWILSSSSTDRRSTSSKTESKSDVSKRKEQQALVLCRLGKTYGQMGQKTKMKETLERAYSLAEGYELPATPSKRQLSPPCASLASKSITTKRGTALRAFVEEEENCENPRTTAAGPYSFSPFADTSLTCNMGASYGSSSNSQLPFAPFLDDSFSNNMDASESSLDAARLVCTSPTMVTLMEDKLQKLSLQSRQAVTNIQNHQSA